MSAANLERFTAGTKVSGSTAAKLVARCQDSVDHPNNYIGRGGADADTWPGTALACAFAHLTTHKAEYLSQAIKYWKASLSDDQALGDGLGCTPANATYDWKTKWPGSFPPPPVLVTITHDTGYPMRWYGPDIALTYDWLYRAAGVDDTLRRQTRSCLTAWLDYYTAKGYLRDYAGSNYNAGFVIGKTLGAIAIGNDGGADGHLWTETLRDVFATVLVGKGLANQEAGAAGPVGVMVGGDWGSWQYGPLSIAEYAAATRAVEEHGAPQPEMDAWIDSLIVRYVHGMLPAGDVQFGGNGDLDFDDQVYGGPAALQADAVLLGRSTGQAAGWARFMRQSQPTAFNASYFWSALADINTVPAQDYRAATPPPPLWYLARGTGTMYVRTSWDARAFWGAFMSAPATADHVHFAASNFVFSRGGDHLIVDSSNYGEPSTLETNGLSADASVTPGDYAQSQTTWSTASLPWARGTDAGVFAARADIAHAFDFNGTPSDIRYAHREWVFLPEGEIVAIDRVHTSAATRGAYVSFHARTAGTLKLDAGKNVAAGTAGGSAIAIHRVALSGGAPAVVKPPVGGCKLKCQYPCGGCTAARFAVDEYAVKIPGPWAVAIHVIDGLGAAEAEAEVGSLNDARFDPAPRQNGGVIGAAVNRSRKQTYVVASSAIDGAAGASMSYRTPGRSPARHIVFDAPEAADGTSVVTAAARGGRCVVGISAGAGRGMTGRPLMFQVSAATDGCAVTELTARARDQQNVAPNGKSQR
jgi:hypothetical protein